MTWYNPVTWGKVEEKSNNIVIGLNDELSNFLRYGNEGGENAASAIELYSKSTAASIPINWISDLFASIEPVLNINDEIVRDHPILDLLNSPSPYFSKELFFDVISKDYLITNELYVVALGNINRPPLEMQPISPRNIDIPQDGNGYPNSINITGNSLNGNYSPDRKGNIIRYYDGNLREIRQVRGYSTQDNSLLRGKSPLSNASAEVRQHILGNTHNSSLLENGGRLSLIFHFDSNLRADEFEETKRRVMEQYGGATKAGKIGVTAGGKLDIKEAGTNNVDMDFSNLHQMAKIAVALQYKFPLPLLTTDASTMNNFKESKLALYDDAVLPLADRIFGGLSKLLVPRFGEDIAKVKITYDIDSVTALASRRIDELLKRKTLNIESDNELRSAIGKDDYEGGDVVLKPANLIPAGTNLLNTDGS